MIAKEAQPEDLYWHIQVTSYKIGKSTNVSLTSSYVYVD